MSDLPPGEYFTAGGDIDEVRVSVRVASDALDPDEVTRLLGVAPSFAARKGEVRRSEGRAVTQRTGVWYVDLGTSTEWVLEDAIGALLDRLPSDPAVWAVLTSKYEVDLSCGLFLRCWNRGFVLPAHVIQRIAERGIEVSVDIYCDAEDKDG